jgi:hypothetical protein
MRLTALKTGAGRRRRHSAVSVRKPAIAVFANLPKPAFFDKSFAIESSGANIRIGPSPPSMKQEKDSEHDRNLFDRHAADFLHSVFNMAGFPY